MQQRWKDRMKLNLPPKLMVVWVLPHLIANVLFCKVFFLISCVIGNYLQTKDLQIAWQPPSPHPQLNDHEVAVSTCYMNKEASFEKVCKSIVYTDFFFFLDFFTTRDDTVDSYASTYHRRVKFLWWGSQVHMKSFFCWTQPRSQYKKLGRHAMS
jgi:hypothetical protein